jgi:hypothetical protein
MNAASLARVIAAGRIILGAGLVSQPERFTVPWIGREGRQAGTKVLARALGARDLVLGAGAIASSEEHLSAWLIAATVADSTDFVATVTAGRAVPLSGRVLVGAMALGGAALGVASLASHEPGRA